jgi:NAD(P)-dependent dehydrogenase (short-subunit alcohol dehydrogenase family)
LNQSKPSSPSRLVSASRQNTTSPSPLPLPQFPILTILSVDVSNQESLEKGFAAFIIDFAGKLDICVPCAGINANVSFLSTTFEQHQKLIGVNVLGVYHTAQLAAKQMITNKTTKGSIILVASIASYMAIRSQSSSAYCGTKGAVRAMVPGIAKELVEYGIRVNSISPGYVRTEMTAPVSFSIVVESEERADVRDVVPGVAGELEG